MGKNENRNPNQQQMGNKGGFQQKNPQGKENLNPGQRPQQNDRNLKNPMGGHGQGQGQQQKQPFIKKEDSWKDKDK